MANSEPSSSSTPSTPDGTPSNTAVPATPSARDLLPAPGKGNEVNAGVPLLFIALVVIAMVVWGAFNS